MPEENLCRCGRLEGLTIEKLFSKGVGCTAPNFLVCPRLDAARRNHPKFGEYLNRHQVAA